MVQEIQIKALQEKIIIALDVPNLSEALRIVEETYDYVGLFKVGLELFTTYGQEVLRAVSQYGKPIFFDGKFHDIPNTVGGACYAAIASGHIAMLNVHALGGSAMLKAAATSCRQAALACGARTPKVLGVTVLTSIGLEILQSEFNWQIGTEELVTRLASLSQAAGLDGVVASPHEVSAIKAVCGKDFLIVTPGVRPLWAETNDQVRIMTPLQALQNGSDYLVIGRPITQAKNRKKAAQRLLAELEDGLRSS